MGISYGSTQRLSQGSIAILAVLAALSFGFSYGNVANQATYFLHALHAIDPTLYPRDWLVQESSAYHPTFRWVALALNAVGPLPWTAAILNALLSVACLILVARVLALWEPAAPRTAFVMALVLIGFDQTVSVAGTYVLGSGLQPSALATVGWCAAIYAFMRDKPLHSGVLLALGGAFHANFLLLGIGLFALAQLLLLEKDWLKRLARQVGPSVIVTLFYLPLILDAGSGEQAPLARTIFQTIRAPHHYVPSHYLFDFVYPAGWLVAGLAASAMLAEPLHRRLSAAFIGSAGICVAGATLLTTVVFVPQISQLFVWRIAPFGQVLAQMAVACALVALVRDPAHLRRHWKCWLGVVLGLLIALRWCLRVMSLTQPRVLIVACALLVIGVLALWQWRRHSGKVPFIAAPVIGLLALALIGFNLRYASGKSTLLGAGTPGSQLSQWAQTTRKDALFLIPPELEEFRLLSKRSVVVDWKSTPVNAAQLLAWYERMSDVAGHKVVSDDDVTRSYRSHDAAKLRQLAAKYGADYVVVTAGHQLDFGQQPVFESRQYRVYAVGAAN